MAKTFQMGARMTLKDQFTATISKVSQASQDFKRNVESTNKSVRGLNDSQSRLRNSLGQYASSTKQACRDSDNLKASMSGLSGAAGMVKKAFAALGIGAAFNAAKSMLVDANANMETYRNTLAVVLKDEKKAVETMAWAEKFAAKTPFEIPQVVEATTKMAAYGINAQQTLGIVGDMASVMGKDLMQAVEAVADAQTGQMERMLEFGVTKKMIEDQAKLMKVTVTNNQGQITDQKAFNAVMFKLMEDRFKGGMDIQSRSFWGMVSNVKDFVSTTLREMGKPLFDKAKEGLGDLLAWLQKLKDNGTLQAFMDRVNQVGSTVFRVIEGIWINTRNTISWITDEVMAWYNNNKPIIDDIGRTFQDAFKKLADFAMPIIAWLKDVGLPGLIDILGGIGTWVLKVAGWFKKNWETVGPLILGVVGAFTAFWTICTIIVAVLKVWAVVQAIVNAVMAANPVMLIVMAIGLLIGAIVLLIKNWDKVKLVVGNVANSIANALKSAWNWVKGIGQSIGNFFVGIWNGIGGAVVGAVNWITGAWQGFKDFFGNLWTGIMEVVKAPVNFLISAVNLLVKGLNSISIDIPDWVPLVGGKKFGFAIPEIPYLAKGTDNWQGGPALMNERGGELAVLPGGSKVIPADKTDKILDKPRGGNVTIHNHINITQQQGEDTETFVNRLIALLLEKFKVAAEIANSGEYSELLAT